MRKVIKLGRLENIGLLKELIQISFTVHKKDKKVKAD